MAPEARRNLVGESKCLSIKRQCELLEINRSTQYYIPKKPTERAIEEKEHLMSRIDFWHTKQPTFGVRRMRVKLQEEGLKVGRKQLKSQMAEMGIQVIYPKPNLSKRNLKHRIYPYLLRNKAIFLANQVWAIDITYIKMGRSHMYLTAIIDWYSRFIVGWALTDTLDTAPVLEAVSAAIKVHGVPSIINSDQGCQFTSCEYIAFLKDTGIRQSMDGKSRWIDNIIIERWFRSLKTEEIYINEYPTPRHLRAAIRTYIQNYNTMRPHQSLAYQTPQVVYHTCFAA